MFDIKKIKKDIMTLKERIDKIERKQNEKTDDEGN